MVESITVGEIIAFIAGAAALVTGLKILIGAIAKGATNWLQQNLAPINQKLDKLDKKINVTELEADKTILVRLIADIKNGNKLTDIEQERFHETYERYTAMGGNSYIHTEVEKLKNEGKL